MSGTKASSRMAKRLLKWLKRLTIGFFALIVILLIVTSSTFDLMIHYGRYQDVIEKARTLTAETNDTVRFAGDWDFDISPGPPPPVSNICARRLEDGTLFVRILVRDLHRFGKSGLLYTENDNASSKSVEMALDSHGCGEWTSKGSIWGPWWALDNNLG
jgi:hypothetical protein